jgi:exopolyphosphatase/guanosine-5'-triphosphate,3'-diphosphate pyrophosphatase
MPTARKTLTLPDHPATLLTALHIGASSVSMMVAERYEDGTLIPVDFLEQPAPLARDIFRNGSVSQSTTERIVAIIKGYQMSLAELGYDPHDLTRAVATNIVSEAGNHEMVMNRIRIACGLRVGTIDDGEMTRLIYLKTRRRLLNLPAMQKHTTLVVHVGPGNTRALLFQEGKISRYTSYRLGTHRTREAVDGSHTEGPALSRVIREHASGNLAQIRFDYSDVTIGGIVAIGYEIQSVATSVTKLGRACSLKTLRQFTAEAATLSDVELVKRFQLDYQTAEALLPALEINLAIAEILKLEACSTTSSSRRNSPAPSPTKSSAPPASSPTAINPTPATASTSARSAPGFSMKSPISIISPPTTRCCCRSRRSFTKSAPSSAPAPTTSTPNTSF